MFRLRLFAIALATACAAEPVVAQQPGLPRPRIDFVTPLGAKAGTTVAELTLSGTDLDGADALLFSHPGIKAELIPVPPPKVDPKAPKKAPEPPKGPLPPGKFKVTVAADVPPGNYDVRAVNKHGVSNPRVFSVGDLPEVLEKEPNNDVAEAMKVGLNTTVNGSIASPTDVDLYQVAVEKGQRVILACMAESIDSRAQPLVEVYDISNRRIASHFGPDAVADFIAPTTGEYFVRVAQFTYTAGGPQYFYRLTVTSNPWIDAAFPPMVEPGKTTAVTLYGRNLPGGTPEPGAAIDGRPLERLVVNVTAPAATEAHKLAYRGRMEPKSGGTDGFEYRIKGAAGISNPILLSFARDPLVVEKEPNDKPDQAMEVPVPCEVAGRIDKRGDADWYAFKAKKGEAVLIDLWGERIGVATDFLFTVRSAKAKTDLVEKDDNPENMSPSQFYARTTDPDPYEFTATEDGTYLVQVRSRESFFFGPRVPYQLRISKKRPDFRLVAMPASDHLSDVTVLGADGHNYLKVFVFRQDGFTGPINLTVEGLPAGVTSAPQVVGSGQRSGALILSAAANAAPFSGPITIKGTATINGASVVREARAATITWSGQPNTNLPMATRLDGSLVLAVRDKAMFRVTAEPENAFIAKKDEKLKQPLTIKQGEKLTVPFKLVRVAPEAKVPITLQQVSTSQNPQSMPVVVNNGQPIAAVAPDKGEGTIVIDARPTGAPGLYEVVMKATAQIQYEPEKGKGKKPATVEQSATPIVVRLVPSTLGRVTASPTGNLKGGMTSVVNVRVDRQNEYAGAFKVKLVLPMNAKGVTSDEVTIPAGQNEAKVTLTAAADAPAGALQNVVVQVTGMHDGDLAITQEAKFNLTVEKAPPPKKEPPKKK